MHVDKGKPKKERITELEAAKYFVATTLQFANEEWPNVAEEVDAKFNVGFSFDLLQEEDQEYQKLAFSLALLAIQMIPLNNIFEKKQAERIHKCVINVFEEVYREKIGTLEAIIGLLDYYETNINYAISIGDNPIDAVAATMLEIISGIPACRSIIETQKKVIKEIIEPWKVIGLSTFISSIASEIPWWKNFKKYHEIIPT